MSLVLYDTPETYLGVVTLNDPDSLNAMSDQMAAEFKKVVAHIRGLPSLPRAIILTGAGRAFSAGGDLQMLDRKRHVSPEDNARRMLDFYDAFLSIRSLNVPLIAMINGHAVGAGLCLASACDIRIASEEAKLGFTFVKLGLHPGMGATYFIPKLIGDERARELLFTGRIIKADEGERIGLVSRVVPLANLREEATALAREIAESGPEAVRLLTETLRGNPALLRVMLEREAECQGKSYASAEFAEGVKAAMEKRQPKFG